MSEELPRQSRAFLQDSTDPHGENLESMLSRDLSFDNSTDQLPVERRRHPRYKCSGSAQLQKEGLTVKTWGTFTDLSKGGCYVELQATFPPGTKLHLTLELNGIKFCPKAVVRVTYPFLGMGLAFIDTTAEMESQLDQMIATLSGPGISDLRQPFAKSAESSSQLQIPLILDATIAVRALVNHFQRAENLGREEFLNLLRNSQDYSRF